MQTPALYLRITGTLSMLFTHFVRETGKISLEEAVHVQTGKLADFFGLTDRGEIAVGKVADLTVFALDELEMRPQEKIYDALQGARTADKVTVFFKDGRAATGALIFNPFKGSGRVIDVEKETSIDFAIENIRDLRLA